MTSDLQIWISRIMLILTMHDAVPLPDGFVPELAQSVLICASMAYSELLPVQCNYLMPMFSASTHQPCIVSGRLPDLFCKFDCWGESMFLLAFAPWSACDKMR
jgi:hypothetical protein